MKTKILVNFHIYISVPFVSHYAGKRKPYVFSFAVSNSWSRQSSDFERPVSKASKTLPWSLELFHVSSITRRQCWALYPFRKTHFCLEKLLSKKVDVWANIHFSKIFDKIGRLLTGLNFSFISFLPFLYKGVTSVNFKEEWKLADLIVPFMLVHKCSASIPIFSWVIIVKISFFTRF